MKIGLEADLSQAESRVVFMLTRDPEMRRLARLPSYEYDAHTENMVTVGLVESLAHAKALKTRDPKLFKKMRHVGKITSHGAQRDMHGNRLSGTLLKELDMAVTAEKCDEYLLRYHAHYPAIRDVYFREIRKLVMRDKMLTNSWGRTIDFMWDRLDDELFRQAYSFLPQSEVADLMNQRGTIPVYHYMMANMGYPPNVQVHDSLWCAVEPEDAYNLAEFMRRSLEVPILIGGEQLVIPVEFKLGTSWGDPLGEEFKRLPDRKEFTALAYAIAERREAEGV